MTTIICLGRTVHGHTYLATALAGVTVIHNTVPELPNCFGSLINKPSWTKTNKGKLSKKVRRK